MPNIAFLRNCLSLSPTSYDQDGAKHASNPFAYSSKLLTPVFAASNPVYEVTLKPTSGTAATLPGSLVMDNTSSALSSLTADLTTRLPLVTSQTYLGMGGLLGFELTAHALPKTTAEIEAGGSPTRVCTGTVTLSYFDLGTSITVVYFSAKFGVNAFGQRAFIAGYSPRELSLSAGVETTLTVALTAFDLNTEIKLLVVCRG